VNWSEVFLGVIALATLVMALIQVGAIVALARVMRQTQQALTTLQQDVRPLMGKIHAIADEISKTAVVATAQAEKVDRLVTDLSRRVDDTAAIVQQAIITPAREGMAIVAALRAGVGALRRTRPARDGRHAEEEDPLFIG
jgi:predicted  nucleic acid-binding Zn-ribbon protein